MICRAQINGRMVQRKYTPISRADVKRNSFELLIKVYFPLPPQFPEGGLMSQHVNSLKIGDEIKVTLPYGRFNYLGKSNCQIRELYFSFNLVTARFARAKLTTFSWSAEEQV